MVIVTPLFMQHVMQTVLHVTGTTPVKESVMSLSVIVATSGHLMDQLQEHV